MAETRHAQPGDGRDLSSRHGLILMGDSRTCDKLVFERPVTIYGQSSFHNCRLGAYTYLGKYAQCTNVTFGRYCSCASHLVMGLGSHSSSWFTTFPFTATSNPFSHVTSHGAVDTPWSAGSRPFDYQPARITVGNDVWIGDHVTFPGARDISVGTGAIIGAYAVVARDIPPYCVAVGNPARVVRQRFSDAVIADLLDSQWWNYDVPACLAANARLVDSKFMREAEVFVSWWKNGGRELLQKYPLSQEWRQVTITETGGEMVFLGKGDEAADKAF